MCSVQFGTTKNAGRGVCWGRSGQASRQAGWWSSEVKAVVLMKCVKKALMNHEELSCVAEGRLKTQE